MAGRGPDVRHLLSQLGFSQDRRPDNSPGPVTASVVTASREVPPGGQLAAFFDSVRRSPQPRTVSEVPSTQEYRDAHSPTAAVSKPASPSSERVVAAELGAELDADVVAEFGAAVSPNSLPRDVPSVNVSNPPVAAAAVPPTAGSQKPKFASQVIVGRADTACPTPANGMPENGNSPLNSVGSNPLSNPLSGASSNPISRPVGTPLSRPLSDVQIEPTVLLSQLGSLPALLPGARVISDHSLSPTTEKLPGHPALHAPVSKGAPTRSIAPATGVLPGVSAAPASSSPSVLPMGRLVAAPAPVQASLPSQVQSRSPNSASSLGSVPAYPPRKPLSYPSSFSGPPAGVSPQAPAVPVAPPMARTLPPMPAPSIPSVAGSPVTPPTSYSARIDGNLAPSARRQGNELLLADIFRRLQEAGTRRR